MPYILEHTKKGWFVAKESNPAKHFSKKPFKTKKEAIQQQKAIYASEARQIKKK
jgi:hypothetical protein